MSESKLTSISLEYNIDTEEYARIDGLVAAIVVAEDGDEKKAEKVTDKVKEALTVILMHRTKKQELDAVMQQGYHNVGLRPQELQTMKDQVKMLDRLRLLMQIDLDQLCRKMSVPIIFK